MDGPQSLYNVIDVMNFDIVEDTRSDQITFTDQTDVALTANALSN